MTKTLQEKIDAVKEIIKSRITDIKECYGEQWCSYDTTPQYGQIAGLGYALILMEIHDKAIQELREEIITLADLENHYLGEYKMVKAIDILALIGEKK